MKKILLNTTTYIGPLGKCNIDFYSLYKNQLYIISEQKLNFLLNYLKISIPKKSKIGFDITTWLYKKNLLNENLLCEISSKILNVPKDFSQNDVYYYLRNKTETKNILDLFKESLINSYIYKLFQNNQQEFFNLISKHFEKRNISDNFLQITQNIHSELFSNDNSFFSKEIKKFNSSAIFLKDYFFFERICRLKEVFSNNTISKQYFFPKRQNLEFIIDENFELDLKGILTTNELINTKIIEFEKEFLNKTLAGISEKQKVFKNSDKTNFRFINFPTILLIFLLFNKNYIYNSFNKKENLIQILKTKIVFVKSTTYCIEPINSTKIKLLFQ